MKKLKLEDPLPFGRLALAKIFFLDRSINRSKIAIYACSGIFVAMLVMYQFGRFESRSSAYKEANAMYAKWRDPQAFNKLEKIVSSHPELQTKFGGLIAQRLLSIGETKRATAYMTKALERAQGLISPYYTRFSKTTLLIADDKLMVALEEAKQLKSDLEKDAFLWEQMDSQKRSGGLLYAYNLIRIAALERELGSKEGEKAAWEEILCNAGWSKVEEPAKTYDPKAYATLARNFQSGSFSLLDYIKQRKKELE
ncbi:hypothetical protein RHABOEDO_000120 [Candidatus Rhabdochlamydia oedothoracis]|uniref:Tetratricopeptide repeat-like domain-containing protein n=1 Tax=Candidatus Rhabdochlamydia oedothoracis TaxID=2720720 RepID=A0ABX8UYJ4_9BACT|nr:MULTISPECIES: hypothetical protein [Rhabdochlamydia]KAG6559888.1 hypothetical protein RHOW815_000071 [Candidatus Rhabdochlamydia sp. W815]MCL6755685.1 hypothetical protein [Candidatus Rhabdochlamydia oedothoracis]QYF48030.1 hypothetical protein RHABOEDO_000120 [Candidatus Rhabdochlamydia oedothoracis]